MAVGAQGPAGVPGPPGPPGAAGAVTLSYIAEIALSGHRVVVLNATAQLIYADSGIAAHANKVLGITTGAAAAGASATVQIGGEVVEPTWSWVLDTPIWLGVDGTLVQVQPTVGFGLIVGFPTSATSMVFGVKEPITLA
jgi:hypothetical protein